MSADSNSERDRQISETVAALIMLRDQLCGMYGALAEKRKQQVAEAGQLKTLQQEMTDLLGRLPRDPLTLESIVRAAARVETSASAIPDLVRNAVGSVGQEAANGLNASLAKQVASLEQAAANASRSAKAYGAAVQQATWHVVLAAVLTSTLGVALIGGFVVWWIPPYEEIQALRAERAQLTAEIATLQIQAEQVRKSNGRRGAKQ